MEFAENDFSLFNVRFKNLSSDSLAIGQFDKNELSISFRSMNLQEREAIAVIALAAALADGNKSESERTQIRELFSNLPI